MPSARLPPSVVSSGGEAAAAPMASEAAPLAATIARPVPKEKSPAASGRYGLLMRSISTSYSCSTTSDGREKASLLREGGGASGRQL